jgi:hypothetical protein
MYWQARWNHPRLPPQPRSRPTVPSQSGGETSFGYPENPSSELAPDQPGIQNLTFKWLFCIAEFLNVAGPHWIGALERTSLDR